MDNSERDGNTAPPDLPSINKEGYMENWHKMIHILDHIKKNTHAYELCIVSQNNDTLKQTPTEFPQTDHITL